MNMFPSHQRHFLLFTSVFATVCLFSGFPLWASDKKKNDVLKPPPQLRADNTVIDRGQSLSGNCVSVVKKSAPSVVYVYSSKKVRRSQIQEQLFDDPIFRRFFGIPDDEDHGDRRRFRGSVQVQQSLGSGVIVASNGYILTNNHVVHGADDVKVEIGENSSQKFTAKVIGSDEQTDIAVLKIEADNLSAITLGNSDKLEVGDTVVAIGNPFGVGMTATHGIVSALRRGGLGIEQYEDFIQTDAPINPGNSGGALLDSEGRLIGINTAILSRTGGSNGIGFAIPINLARSIMEQLVAHGHVDRGFLGVSSQGLDPYLAKQFHIDYGALLTEVVQGSAADKAGLKRGDVITKINNSKIDDPRNLALTVARLSPDAEITIHYVRHGKNKETKAKLGYLFMQKLAGRGADHNHYGLLSGIGVDNITRNYSSNLNVPQNFEGAVVTQVDPDSASARAGLQKGDIILEIDDKRVHDAFSAVKLSEKIKGPKVLVLIWHKGVYQYLVVDESKK